MKTMKTKEKRYELRRSIFLGQWVIICHKTNTTIDFQFDSKGTKINMLEDLQIKVDKLNS